MSPETPADLEQVTYVETTVRRYNADGSLSSEVTTVVTERRPAENAKPTGMYL